MKWSAVFHHSAQTVLSSPLWRPKLFDVGVAWCPFHCNDSRVSVKTAKLMIESFPLLNSL